MENTVTLPPLQTPVTPPPAPVTPPPERLAGGREADRANHAKAPGQAGQGRVNGLTNQTRSTPAVEKPFTWQSKAALRKIREAFDQLPFLDQAISVYLTLTEFASDAQSESFTRRRRQIAERSGVSLSRVQTILNIFKKIGVVTWKQNRGAEGTQELAPSTYTLCSVCPTQCTGNPTSCKNQKRQTCTVDEQSPEKSPNNNDKASTATKANKLSARQKELADRFEAALRHQWTNDAGKWISRIKSAPGKSERVVAEVESASREGRLKATHAQFAEQIWKEFTQ